MSAEDILTAEQHSRIFQDDILTEYRVSEKTSFEAPRAIILAGQPGAGKRSLSGIAK